MSLTLDNYCFIDYHSAPLAEYDPNSPPAPNTDFMVHIHATFTHVPFHVMEEEEEHDMLSVQYQIRTCGKSFETQSGLLIREDEAPCASNIANMLSEVNVTEDAHEDVIRQISAAARRMAAGNKNATGNKSLTMSVHIGLVVFEDPEDFEDVNDDEGELGANKTAVEALEKVSVKEGDDVLHECAICLETIEVGSEGIRMPCSHMFHGGCILCWLQKSKVCPYCRFMMP